VRLLKKFGSLHPDIFLQKQLLHHFFLPAQMRFLPLRQMQIPFPPNCPRCSNHQFFRRSQRAFSFSRRTLSTHHMTKAGLHSVTDFQPPFLLLLLNADLRLEEFWILWFLCPILTITSRKAASTHLFESLFRLPCENLLPTFRTISLRLSSVRADVGF